jgi:hypothetical protein
MNSHRMEIQDLGDSVSQFTEMTIVVTFDFQHIKVNDDSNKITN